MAHSQQYLFGGLKSEVKMHPQWVGYGHSSTGSNHGTVSIGSLEDVDSHIQSMIDDSDIQASSDIQQNVDRYKAGLPLLGRAKQYRPYIPPAQRQTMASTSTEHAVVATTHEVEASHTPQATQKRLPELRSTAKKYGRWMPQREREPQFSASFLANAFPDFTGPATQNASIELGRAVSSRQASSNPRPVEAPPESISQVMESLKRHTLKMKNRRETARMQAHVNDGSERSMVTVGPTDGTSKSPSGPITHLCSDDTIPDKKNTTKSFVVTNLPDMSGIIASQRSKSQVIGENPRHILTAAKDAPIVSDLIEKAGLRQDEKDIWISIDVLQDRVRALEKENADLKLANAQNTCKKRPDSAYGPSASDEESDSCNIGLKEEKMRLLAEIAKFRKHHETLEKTIANAEIRLRTNTAERDQACTTLANLTEMAQELDAANGALRRNLELEKDRARTDTQDLKAEKDQLSQENQYLRLQVARFQTEASQNNVPWVEKERALIRSLGDQERTFQEDRRGLLKKLKRQERLIASLQATIYSAACKAAQNTIPDERSESCDELTSSTLHRAIVDVTLTEDATSHSADFGKVAHDIVGQVQAQLVATKLATSLEIVDRHSETQDRRPTSSPSNPKLDTVKVDNQIAQDVCSDNHHIGIRGKGPDGRLSRLSGCSSNHSKNTSDQVFINGESTVPGLEHDGNIPAATEIRADEEPVVHTSDSNRRRRAESDSKVDNAKICMRQQPTTSHRRSLSDRLASAFTISDVDRLDQHVIQPKILSTRAQNLIDGLCKHCRSNCTICTRITSRNVKTHKKRTITIERPVPVSDTMDAADAQDLDLTLRPAMDPGLALATIIKGLSDEIDHLHAQIIPLNARWMSVDARMGIRKRKAMRNELNVLEATLERKSDQMYSLHDVLEGQKVAGQLMTTEEVDLTVRSIIV